MKKDWKAHHRKNDTAKFRENFDKLGFKQTEVAILLDRTPTCVGFYYRGQRYIPPAVALKMQKLLDAPRDQLLQAIVKGKKHE
jgi:hypothetical protein